ncbi:acyltransferase [Microbacterium sp. NPDC096154]|uniref:acyltransferase family protein n=1 Tax=Microbacterium sp. NPDC096154 TaxID=3155549 RepID=UPI00332B87A3
MTSISPVPPTPPTPASRRLHALDGLRGLAAFAVLLHHTALTVPTFAAAYFGATSDATWEPGTLAWWAAHTPLHSLWDGEAAVMIFFVLSGFVLTLPVLHSRSFRWDAYLPQRFTRLYLPVWAALAFAILMILITPRGTNDDTEWLRRRPDHVTLEWVLQGLVQIGGGSEILSPLWTIRWEILFSLLLGLFVWAALRTNPAVMLVASLVLIGMGEVTDVKPLKYLPMFLIGVVLAVHRDAFSTRLGAVSRRGWITALAITPVLVASPWMLPPIVPEAVRESAIVLQVAGAVLIVAACAFGFPDSRFLGSRAVQWLGRVSFSLYLVHETIVITCADLLGPDRHVLMALIVIPVSLLVAQLFFVAIERPCHRLARRVHAGFADAR